MLTIKSTLTANFKVKQNTANSQSVIQIKIHILQWAVSKRKEIGVFA